MTIGSGAGIGRAGELASSFVSVPGIAVRRHEQVQAGLTELRGMVNDPMLGLTDDELLLRVGQYTQELDMDIRSKLNGMRSRAADSRILGSVLAEITRQVSEAGADRNGKELNLDKEITYQDEHGVTQTAKLGELMERYGINEPGAIVKMDDTMVQSLRTKITSLTDDLRASGESSQIELQQVMSRRSQMLQIVSNIMASRNDSRKSIAQNVRG